MISNWYDLTLYLCLIAGAVLIVIAVLLYLMFVAAAKRGGPNGPK